MASERANSPLPRFVHIFFGYLSPVSWFHRLHTWDEVCSPKMQRWSLFALADLYVITAHTHFVGVRDGGQCVVSCWRRPSQTRSKPEEAHRARRRKRRRGTMPRRTCAVCRAEFNCPASFRGKAPKCSGCRPAQHERRPLPAGDEGYKEAIRRLSANDASISSLKHVYLVTGTYVMVEDYSYLRLLLPPTFIVSFASIPR